MVVDDVFNGMLPLVLLMFIIAFIVLIWLVVGSFINKK